jgi:hypothetical protein
MGLIWPSPATEAVGLTMHRRIGRWLFVLFVLLADTQVIEAACVDPTQLAHAG